MANPKLKIFRTGQWDRVKQKIDALGDNIQAGNLLAMQHVTLQAERIAVKYLQSQSLSWQPLSPKYLAWKIKNRKSDKILISSSTYFQSIRSWVDKTSMTGYAGVRRDVKTEDGKESLANIALIMEYGSPARNIPARPLWRPTLNLLKAYINKNKIFEKSIFDKM